MPIIVCEDYALISSGKFNGRRVPFKDFPEMWRRQFEGDPFTGWLEDFAAQFIANDLPPADCFLFLRFVCGWGGLGNFNQRQIAEWIRARGSAHLREHLVAARELSIAEDYEEAINKVTEIKGLGISFGSKVLRFLAPANAAVLDKKIRYGFGYEDNSEIYGTFVRHCLAIAARLNKKNRPKTTGEAWRATDVELALFNLTPEK